MKSVFEQATKICTPTKEEQASIAHIVKEVEAKVNSSLKKLKIDARCAVGGSVAKGTWLPGVSDVDFFILFDYEKYKGQSHLLSDITERAVRRAFQKVERLHGSRDYFNAEIAQRTSLLRSNAKYKKFILEFVPVLEISELSDALNLTDYSPLHIYWVRDRIKANKKLQTEVRLAKQFFKANGVYGAESYIGGFSGHATEILTIYYSSFLSLLRNAAEWTHGEVIDVNHTYRDPNQVFDRINEAKLQSPIIVIDPVEPTRNAAAALGEEKFRLLKKAAKRFLETQAKLCSANAERSSADFAARSGPRNQRELQGNSLGQEKSKRFFSGSKAFSWEPTADFFKIKQFEVTSLKQKAGQKLFVLQATPSRGKEDVVGCRLLKQFAGFQKEIERNGFKIIQSGWHWAGNGPATFWLYLPAKPLPKERLIEGPPKNVPDVFIRKFRRKWGRVFLKRNRYYARAARKYREPEKLIKKLAKAHKFRLLTS